MYLISMLLFGASLYHLCPQSLKRWSHRFMVFGSLCRTIWPLSLLLSGGFCYWLLHCCLRSYRSLWGLPLRTMMTNTDPWSYLSHLLTLRLRQSLRLMLRPWEIPSPRQHHAPLLPSRPAHNRPQPQPPQPPSRSLQRQWLLWNRLPSRLAQRPLLGPRRPPLPVNVPHQRRPKPRPTRLCLVVRVAVPGSVRCWLRHALELLCLSLLQFPCLLLPRLLSPRPILRWRNSLGRRLQSFVRPMNGSCGLCRCPLLRSISIKMVITTRARSLALIPRRLFWASLAAVTCVLLRLAIPLVRKCSRGPSAPLPLSMPVPPFSPPQWLHLRQVPQWPLLIMLRLLAQPVVVQDLLHQIQPGSLPPLSLVHYASEENALVRRPPYLIATNATHLVVESHRHPLLRRRADLHPALTKLKPTYHGWMMVVERNSWRPWPGCGTVISSKYEEFTHQGVHGAYISVANEVLLFPGCIRLNPRLRLHLLGLSAAPKVDATRLTQTILSSVPMNASIPEAALLEASRAYLEYIRMTKTALDSGPPATHPPNWIAPLTDNPQDPEAVLQVGGDAVKWPFQA